MTALELVQRFFPNVTQVKDSNKTITVEVTDKDNNSAKVRNHKECAFAVACKRNHLADEAIISRKISYLIKGNVATRFSTPESLAREIVSFDRKAGFEPGIYQLAKPSPTSKLNSGRNYSKSNKGTKSPKRFIHITQSVRERTQSK